MFILDLSKKLKCEFHYDYIKKEYGNISTFLFTDIDSLMYDIKTKDAYEDFCNYSTKSKYYEDPDKGEKRKMKNAKMKNETSGVAIKELVALKPKLYLLEDGFILRWA